MVVKPLAMGFDGSFLAVGWWWYSSSSSLLPGGGILVELLFAMIIVVVVKIFCIFEEEEDFQIIVFLKIRVTEISKPVKQPQPRHMP